MLVFKNTEGQLPSERKKQNDSRFASCRPPPTHGSNGNGGTEVSTSLALMMTSMLREQMAALPPSIALQQFAKHVNESADQSAIDVRSG